jgi:hypothetical protein
MDADRDAIRDAIGDADRETFGFTHMRIEINDHWFSWFKFSWFTHYERRE